MRFFVATIKFLALIAILFVGLIALLIWYSLIPSDSRIQEQFTKNKVALTSLLNKLSREPPTIVGVTKDKVMLNDTSNWVLPENAGFSSERFTDYQTLMREANVSQVWRKEGQTDFYVCGFGIVGSGWRLSFEYSATTPTPLVTSINAPRHQKVVYRSLGDNWYMRLLFE